MSIQKLDSDVVSLNPQSNNLHRLLMSISQFVALLKKYNINVNVNTNNPKTEQAFKALSESRQIAIIESFDKYKQMIIRAIENQVEIQNEVELLEFIIKDLRVCLSTEALTTIKPQYIIEIYSLDFKQIYRSMNFLSFCGYDLFELLTYEFYELYERSTSINEYLVKACVSLQDRPYNYVENLSNIPTHLMREKFSSNRTHSLIRFKNLALLRTTDGEPFGYIITQRIKQIKNNPALDSVDFI